MSHLPFQLLRTVFRCAFPAAVAFSALLFFLLLLLWPLTCDHRRGAALEIATTRHAFGLGFNQGQMTLVMAEATGDPLRPGILFSPCIADHADRQLLPGWDFAAWGDEAEPGYDGIVGRQRFLGLEARLGLPGYWRALFFDFPLPYLLLLTSLPPALWLRRSLRHHREKRARGFPIQPVA